MTFRSLGFFASSGARGKPGMVLLKPTSVDHSGTSASIGAKGQVTFTAVTSLSLNGVFSATYDNYVISIRHKQTSGGADGLNFRLRAAGTDASGSNYTAQRISAASTTAAAVRFSNVDSGGVGFCTQYESGDFFEVYGPFLAQPTATRNISGSGVDYAAIYEYANTHSLSSSYDGISFFPLAGPFTGALQVYGVRG